MRILFLAWNYPPALGGIEYVARHLTAGLALAGDDVHIIARHESLRSEPDSPSIHRPGRPGLPAYLGFSAVVAWKLLHKMNVDVIVCPGIVDAPAAWLMSKFFKIPYVVLAHGSDVLHKGLLYRPGMRFLFRRASGVAANSHFTRNVLEDIGCDPKRLRVIHPGVCVGEYPAHSTTWRESVRAKHGLIDRKVLLTVGRLIRRKGVLDFVDNVLPKLVRSSPDVLYLVIGDDARQSLTHKEPMSGRIHALVQRRGLERHVRLLGAVDDETLQELQYAADLHVLPVVELPGDAEGFGIVLLEAALARTPVVASATGGIPEAVGSEAGVLVQPGDWQEFLRVISSLLLDVERREHMGSAGRERVRREFDWPVIVKQYRAFFKTVSAHQAK